MSIKRLGLLGPAGSGKDLIGDILVDMGLVKVSFADPMKRFVRKMFNVSIEALWGESALRNLPFAVTEQWWFEAIGHLPEAATEIVQDVLDDGNRVKGYLELQNWFTYLRKTYPDVISARLILQTLGTEWGRRAVDENVWTRYTHTKVIPAIADGRPYHYENGLGAKDHNYIPAVGVVIPDHRFKNEIEFTQGHDGFVIRLRRLSLEKKDETVGIAGHQSEAEQKTLPDSLFDYVLELEEGVDKVREKVNLVYEGELWRMKQASNRS